MEVIEFRKIRRCDRTDLKYNNWSRIYEYPLILDFCKEYCKIKNPKIHNTSWGFEGCHVQFKNDLEDLSNNCIHSDQKKSNLPKTYTWDITTNPRKEWLDNFDIVINVSTMEEVNYDHVKIFKNLLSQTKKGGFVIITFDLPGLQLDKFEKMLNSKIVRFDDEISGVNSEIISEKYSHLSCGFLVVKK